jgi:GMP synthase-like glutamine amidotransferase
VKPVLVRQHGDTVPPSILGEWLRDRSIPAVIHPAYLGFPAPDPEHFSFIASLGSANSPKDAVQPDVADELRLLERAIDADVPVLGLCFGGQALAVALGGEVVPADRPELGWYEVETDDPDLILPGPWLQWHYDRFTVPDGAQELARSETGSQAFSLGRSLGLQFHPESRIEQAVVWARKDAAKEKLAKHGIADGVALAEAGREHQEAAVRAAFDLFDGFWARVQGEEER